MQGQTALVTRGSLLTELPVPLSERNISLQCRIVSSSVVGEVYILTTSIGNVLYVLWCFPWAYFIRRGVVVRANVYRVHYLLTEHDKRGESLKRVYIQEESALNERLFSRRLSSTKVGLHWVCLQVGVIKGSSKISLRGVYFRGKSA